MAQRFEGRNLEEALGHAAAAFGVDRYRLTYHVVLEKRGFLGGMKRVVIEAEINEAATEPPAAPAYRPEAPREARPREARPAARGRGDREGGRRRESPRGGRGERHRDRGRREERFDDEPLVEVPEQGPESEAAATVRSWCEEILRMGGFDLQVRTEENEQQVVVRLYGRDSRLLTEHHGEALDALQVLANKALGGRKVEKDIEFDCSEFKERRVEELERRAHDTAERVRRERKELLLPAMTPIERRIVHLALQDDAEVTTESRGEGFYKRVAVKLRSGGVEVQPEP